MSGGGGFPSSSPPTKRQRVVALAFLFFAILWWSPDALLVRLYKSDAATQLATKNLMTSLAVLFYLLYSQGPKAMLQDFKENTRFTLIQGCALTSMNSCFTIGLQYTDSGTFLVLLAAAPLLSSVLSRFFLAEPIKLSTSLAIVFGMIGVGIVSIGNIAEESKSGKNVVAGKSNTIGILIGMFNTVVCASYLVLCRYMSKKAPSGSGLLGLLFFGPFSSIVGLMLGAQPLNPADVWLLFVQGFVMLPVGFVGVALSTRTLSASEVGMIQLVETIFGPVWVWAGGFEVPPTLTFVGGSVLLGTLLAYFAVSTMKGEDPGGGGEKQSSAKDEYLDGVLEGEERSDDIKFERAPKKKLPLTKAAPYNDDDDEFLEIPKVTYSSSSKDRFRRRSDSGSSV
jgi:drug/metabolite transporter (DMT)-like permease